jgi:hypothetical protein
MKTKVVTILFCLFFTAQIALSGKGSALNDLSWQNKTESINNLSVDYSLTDNEDPYYDPAVPVSDSILFLVFLMGVYGIFLLTSRKLKYADNKASS